MTRWLSGFRGRILGAALAAFVVGFGYTLCVRSITLADEGYLLVQSLEIAKGKMLYRDLDAFVAPGVWLAMAGLFRLVEPSVFATRMLALALYATTAWLLWRIVRRVSGPVAALGALFAYGVFTVWAFPSWTFSFYSPYSITAALGVLDRLLAWSRTRRTPDLFVAGLLLGLSGAFKQNFGALACLASAATVAIVVVQSAPDARRAVAAIIGSGVWIVAGVLCVIAPIAAYFAYNGAFADAVHALLVRPFGEFAGQHTIAYLSPRWLLRNRPMDGIERLTYTAAPFINVGFVFRWSPSVTWAVERLHALLYWMPPVILASAGALVVATGRQARRLDTDLCAVLLFAGCLFLGVFPRADFNHLVHVYQPILLITAVVIERVASLPTGGMLATALPALALALLAPYAAVAADWYLSIVRTMGTPIESPRGGILLDPWMAGMLDYEVKTIRSRTAEGAPVLTAQGLAMLNFLADRPVPGKYANLYAVHIAHDQGEEVVEEAEASGVHLAVVNFSSFFSDPIGLRAYAPVLSDYLNHVFEPVEYIAADKAIILERRAVPRPRVDSRSVLNDCDADDKWWGRRVVQEHLLFDSLFHRLRGAEDLVTTCVVDAPAGSVLSVRIGYRRPLSVEEGSTIISEIWAASADDPEAESILVFEMSTPIVAVTGWGSPPPAEYRVPLGEFVGGRVRLAFVTRFEGEMEMNPFDFSGFGAVWADPWVEVDSSGPVLQRK